MRNSSLLRAAVATTVLIGVSVAAQAQSEPQKITKTAKTKQQKPAVKSHKVWTEDDISIVRTPADVLIDAKDRQSTAQGADGAPSVQPASEKQPVANPPKPTKAPPLSQAKSVEEAETKITWEKRDIQGQEEYLARMQEQLDQAPPDQKEHIQKLIEQHKQILADTRKELQGLEGEKRDLQKSPAKPTASAESQPPSQ